MKRFRYSAWDGTQAFADIEADDVLDQAVDDLLQHGDLTWAMRRLFEQGLTLRGQRRVEGIRDLIKRLQRIKQEATGQFDVQSLFEALKQQIGQLTQEHLTHMSRMLQALNELLQQRERGLNPSLDEFLKQFGQYFPNLEQADLDTLMQRTSELQLLYDTGHLALAGAEPLRVLRRHAGRVAHVHLKDVRPEVVQRVRAESLSFAAAVRAGVFTVPGDGGLDFEPLLAVLAAHGYRGWLVVEAEQDPRLAPPLHYARLGRAHLHRLLTLVFQREAQHQLAAFHGPRARDL